MSQLLDYTENVEITTYVSVETEQDVNVIENTALDGSYYQQIVGEPSVMYEVTAYVDRDGRTALQTAEAAGNLLKVTMARGTYYGRIMKAGLKFGARLAYDYFKATIKLAKEA